VKRGGQIWVRVFPDVPVTKKPLEVRMGSGKGNVEYWVAKVQPGKVLFEMEGVPEKTAREAFRLAGAKLSVATTFVKRQVRTDESERNAGSKSAPDLTTELLKLRKEQFALRMQRATGQAAKPDQFGKVRKTLRA
jgi:ribosomal protein L29